MSLDEYNRKRKFADTPEPEGPAPGKSGRQNRRFVIQKHNASRLHYDFRLETEDGVLKSWAVPKGVSMNPEVKRLAVLTEDHPLDYAYFEGVIPKGNYGAGTVIVWDSGTYSTGTSFGRQFEQGKIRFNLSGQKLKGGFSLVRMNKSNDKGDDNGKQWLLIKSKDEFVTKEDLTLTRPESVFGKTTLSRPGKKNEKIGKEGPLDKNIDIMTTPIRPMLAVPVDKPFDDKDWVFEVKWDGVRCIYIRDKAGKVQSIQARKGSSISHRYPEVLEGADSAIQCENSVVLDGELVVLNDNGHPDFQKHQQRMNVDYPREIAKLSREIPATYFVFDILYLDGKSLESLEFIERRKILSQVIGAGSKKIRISDFIEEAGIALFKQTTSLGLEGIVAKYKHAKYIQGTRSDSWLKIKSIQTQDCMVIGYTPGEGNREGYFGSLILAAYREGKPRFVGHSGSGFGLDQLASIYEKLSKIQVKVCPIDGIPYVNRTPVWVVPEIVVEVKFNGWTRDKIMRAPIFTRIRDDKPPSECIIEVSKDAESTVEQAEETAREPEQLEITNSDKVFWPATKEHRLLTKADLVQYYEDVSKFILPHLRDRPISMSRYPDGITGKSFYQKDWNQKTPDFVRTIQVFSETRNDTINYVICNNRETLGWLANLGCIEMHPWYSRVFDYKACTAQAKKGKVQGPAPLDEDICGLDTPDYVVFDLDPYIYSGKEKAGQEPEYNLQGFKAAVEVALNLKDLLDEIGIKGFVKTSGKTGLHIFIPLTPDYSYGQTRNFAQIIGKILLVRRSELITMDWNTSKREGKVFFDYNQNARGKTIASALSLRPSSSATVSMPVKWEELADIVPTDFTIETVSALLRSRGDAWKDILRYRQNIAVLLERVSSIGL